MPKKFVGENSKAVAARARKAAAKEAETVKKVKEAEDKAWEDNDKQVLKKKQKQVRASRITIDKNIKHVKETIVSAAFGTRDVMHILLYSGRSREKTSTAIRKKSGGESPARGGNGKHKSRWQAAGVENY